MDRSGEGVARDVMESPALDIHVAQADEMPAALSLLRSFSVDAAAAFEERLAPNEFVLVAYLDPTRAPVGIVFGRRPTPEGSALLQYLVVDTDRRRQHIGYALVERFCDESRKRGALQAALHYGPVLFGSDEGRELTAFYTSCGFERVGSYMLRRVDGPNRG